MFVNLFFSVIIAVCYLCNTRSDLFLTVAWMARHSILNEHFSEYHLPVLETKTSVHTSLGRSHPSHATLVIGTLKL